MESSSIHRELITVTKLEQKPQKQFRVHCLFENWKELGLLQIVTRKLLHFPMLFRYFSQCARNSATIERGEQKNCGRRHRKNRWVQLLDTKTARALD
jgi:hypothetical protein